MGQNKTFNQSFISHSSRALNTNLTMVRPGHGDDPKSCLGPYNFACDSSEDDEYANIKSPRDSQYD